ncbi:hypothetical protein [Lignipirellula cremea]|uniref:Uncharacterized protein n=1 Tax=Lignipirellula cremea TaxID=2528010 RepID=A0A518DPL9_9BACT|nr:hypothetical protein [Lignipirellula cremea]QDU93782.1 hypothetical protein Pla8534_15650 [Lignipirellula cremea]
MSPDVKETIKTCPQCHADNGGAAARCWLCQADITQAKAVEVVLAELVDERPDYAPKEIFFMVLTGATALVVLLAGVGMMLESPEQGIGYFVLTAIPLTAAAVHLIRRRARGQEVTWQHRFLAFWISVGVFSVVIFGLVVVSLVCLFLFLFIVCLDGGGFGHAP